MDNGRIKAEGEFAAISECDMYQRYLEINRQFEESNRLQAEARAKEAAEKSKQEELEGVTNGVKHIEVSIRKKSKDSSDAKINDNVVSTNPTDSDTNDTKEITFESKLIKAEDREKGNLSWNTIKLF